MTADKESKKLNLNVKTRKKTKGTVRKQQRDKATQPKSCEANSVKNE